MTTTIPASSPWTSALPPTARSHEWSSWSTAHGSLESAYAFAAELIQRLDAEIGPDLQREQTILAEDDAEI